MMKDNESSYEQESYSESSEDSSDENTEEYETSPRRRRNLLYGMIQKK